VAGGAALSQGITFLAAPVLTRLYTPADFGLFGTYGAVVALGAVASGLRYELAVALPKGQVEAANVAALAATATVVLPAVMLVIIVLLPAVCQCEWGDSALVPYLWALPLGVAAAGLYQVATYRALRYQAFRAISISRICQSFSAAGLQLLLGWAGWNALGLMAGSVASHLVGMVSLVAGTRKGLRREWAVIRWRRMRLLGRRYDRFPRFSVFEGLAMVAGMQLPILLLAASFAATVVGQFVLAVQVAQAPLRLLGGAVGQVFVSQAAQYRWSDRLDELVADAFRMLARLGIVPLALFAVIAPDAFVLVFGDQWQLAGIHARWMTPLLTAEFLFLPLSAVIAVTEHQRTALITRVLLVALPALTIQSIAWSSGDPQAAVKAFSLVGLVAYLAYGAWLMKISGVRAAVWLKILMREVALAIPTVAALIGAKLWLGSPLPAPAFAGLGVVAAATWLLFVVRRMQR
jgi:O-antigen/teichoic acid export membrane protein